MNTALIPVLLLSVMCGGVPAKSECAGLSAEEVGKRYGDVIVGLSEGFARLGLYGEPNCDGSSEERALCAQMGELGNVVERMNSGARLGCFDENGSYEQSPEATTFKILRKALSSESPIMRWQILTRMFILCDSGTLLTPAGQKGCGRVVGESAIEILRSDNDKVSRHLALEILGSKFASEASRDMLNRIAREGISVGSTCPHGLGEQGAMSWEDLAKGLKVGQFRCEQQLAREALQRLSAAKGRGR